MADLPFFVKLPDIFNVIRIHAAVPVCLLIHVVDHAQIDVIGIHAPQDVFKSSLCLLHVPRADVLAVLPGGADMPLHDPFFALSFHGLPDDVPGFRVRHPAVNDVDALFPGIAQQFHGFRFVVALQPFPAETDLTDLQSCLSQCAILHMSSAAVCPSFFCHLPFF